MAPDEQSVFPSLTISVSFAVTGDEGSEGYVEVNDTAAENVPPAEDRVVDDDSEEWSSPEAASGPPQQLSTGFVEPRERPPWPPGEDTYERSSISSFKSRAADGFRRRGARFKCYVCHSTDHMMDNCPVVKHMPRRIVFELISLCK